MTKLKKKEKKRVHWISEAFTLIIFKKAYRRYFQNQQALQNIVQHLVHKEQISTQATCQIMFSNLFLVVPFHLRKVNNHLNYCLPHDLISPLLIMEKKLIEALSLLYLLKSQFQLCFIIMLLCTYRSNLSVMKNKTKNKTSVAGLTK